MLSQTAWKLEADPFMSVQLLHGLADTFVFLMRTTGSQRLIHWNPAFGD